MTQARAHTVAEGGIASTTASRAACRAWLCGFDPLTRVDREQRKHMVEARIRELGSIFAVGIYAYAVMSNHLHVVVSVEPAAAADWTAQKIAERWLRLYPIRDEERYEARKATLMASIDIYRMRLCDLSWFMKSWTSTSRAGPTPRTRLPGDSGRPLQMSAADGRGEALTWPWPMSTSTPCCAQKSPATSRPPTTPASASRQRTAQVAGEGQRHAATTRRTVRISATDDRSAVHRTGRLHRPTDSPDKRGAIAGVGAAGIAATWPRPGSLDWACEGHRPAYWRIVGSVEAIKAKAIAIKQEWMKGIGYAGGRRFL
ncbi:MAG: hypothetical protein U1F26_14710 [Lysobacterales bacterium]